MQGRNAVKKETSFLKKVTQDSALSEFQGHSLSGSLLSERFGIKLVNNSRANLTSQHQTFSLDLQVEENVRSELKPRTEAELKAAR